MLHKDREYLYTNYVDLKRPIQEIARECNVSKSTLEKSLFKLGLTNLRSRLKYSININKIVPSPEMYYFMGLVATDGYISLKTNRISIRLRNQGAKELLNSLKEYFEFSGNVRVYDRTDYDLTITSKELIDFLSQNNIKGDNKTFSVRVPDYFPDEDCARLFLRGVLDGDGNIHLTKHPSGKIKNYEFRIVTGSLGFMEGLQKLFKQYLNIETPLKVHRVKEKEYPSISLKSSESKNFYRWVYQGYTTFRLKDKFDKAKLVVEDIV